MTQVGITLDTGALLALERRNQLMRSRLDRASALGVKVIVPAVVLMEWWRGTRLHRDILQRLVVEPTTEQIAKAAGEALANLHGATPIDAAVMASAALRGDVVYTSDVNDLERLRTHFRAVRAVLSVSGKSG